MNPLEIIKSVVGIVLMLAIAWLAWNYIDDKKQLAALQAVIEQTDSQAHEQQKQQEANYETVKTESDRRAADIARYRRMLQSADKAKASRDANFPAISGGAIAAVDAGGVGCSTEYRAQCLAVINRAVTCRDLILLNKFPLR